LVQKNSNIPKAKSKLMKLFKNVHRNRGKVLGCQDEANFDSSLFKKYKHA